MARRSGGKKPNLTNKQLRWLHANLDKGNVPAARVKKLKAEGKLQKAVKTKEPSPQSRADSDAPKVNKSASSAIDRLPQSDEEFRAQFQRDQDQHNTQYLSRVPDPVASASAADKAVVQEAFSNYQGGQAYIYINNSLRGTLTEGQREDLDGYDLDADIRNLRRAVEVASVPLPRDVPLYRGVSGEMAAQLRAQHQQGSISGSVIEDKAFMSTTTSAARAAGVVSSGRVVIEMTPGAQTRAAPMRTGKYDEAEVLFAPGARMRISGSRITEQGVLVVQADLE